MLSNAPAGPEEDGFTIIELLVAMMVMLLITVPLVASFVVGVKTSLGGQQDATNSADAQLLGYWFDADIASAESVAPTSASCGKTGTVLELTWTDGGTVKVAYRAVADAARQAELALSTPVYRLERVRCSGGPDDVTVIGRTLIAPPTALCDDAACTAGQTPRRVAIKVKERITTTGSTTSFDYGVTAARRVTP